MRNQTKNRKKRMGAKWMAVILAGGLLTAAPVMAFGEAPEEPQSETEMETEQETELVYEKKLVMYMTDDVYVREAPDTEATAIAVAKRGGKITVIGEIGDWYHVRLGEEEPGEETEETADSAEASSGEAETEGEEETEQDRKEGYVIRKYVTDSEEEADQAVKAQEYAVKAAEEEAARQQAIAWQQQNQKPASQGKHEVSRQKYDDCDGSGHGYYEIQYSDGSTSIEEY